MLIGQVLPVMAKQFSLTDLQLSYFFPAQFAGSLGGTFLTSRFSRKDNYLGATIVGCLLMTAGLAMMNIGVFGACLVGFLVNGIGIGMTLPSINMLILEAAEEHSASALVLLNFFWGVGAIISKPFVDLFSGEANLGITTYVLAAPIFLFAIVLLLIARTSKQKIVVDHATLLEDPTPIWTTSLAWMIAAFNFVHVGFESGMGGWLTTYTTRVEGAPVLAWLSPTLLYFSFFVIGRGIAPLMFRFLNENRMLILGLALVLLGMIVLLTAKSVSQLSIGSVIAGFGTSWIFPTNVSRFSKTFGPTASRRATPLFIMGTLGSTSITWLIGFISDRTGSLNSGMYVLAISVVLLIVLQVALSLRKSSP